MDYIRPAMPPLLPTYNPENSINLTCLAESPTASPTTPTFKYYHTYGNQIVDQDGIPKRFTGISW
jgi:hypothetical protein